MLIVPAKKPKVPPTADTTLMAASELVSLSIRTAEATDKTRASREARISEE